MSDLDSLREVRILSPEDSGHWLKPGTVGWVTNENGFGDLPGVVRVVGQGVDPGVGLIRQWLVDSEYELVHAPAVGDEGGVVALGLLIVLLALIGGVALGTLVGQATGSVAVGHLTTFVTTFALSLPGWGLVFFDR